MGLLFSSGTMLLSFPLIYIYFIAVAVLTVPEIYICRKEKGRRNGLIIPIALSALALIRVALSLIKPDDHLIGASFWSGAAYVLALIFVSALPAMALFGVYIAYRLKKTWFWILLCVLTLVFLPVPLSMADGGSVSYRAAAYELVFIHRIDSAAPNGTGYKTGIRFYPLPSIISHGRWG